MALSKLVSIEEVTQAFGISEKTVRRMVERGQLRAIRIGGSVRFSEDELNAIVASGGTEKQ